MGSVLCFAYRDGREWNRRKKRPRKGLQRRLQEICTAWLLMEGIYDEMKYTMYIAHFAPLTFHTNSHVCNIKFVTISIYLFNVRTPQTCPFLNPVPPLLSFTTPPHTGTPSPSKAEKINAGSEDQVAALPVPHFCACLIEQGATSKAKPSFFTNIIADTMSFLHCYT